MPKDIKNPILTALEQYERDPDRNGKKAFLLTPQGGYFLYGNRFCSITEYELELLGNSCQIQGRTVRKPLFLHLKGNQLEVIDKQLSGPALVSLIFHIDLGEDEPFRGILLAHGQKAKLALFHDSEMEELYRLSRIAIPSTVIPVSPDGEFQQFAENLRKNDLHWLTSLYLRGQQLKYLPDAGRSDGS